MPEKLRKKIPKLKYVCLLPIIVEHISEEIYKSRYLCSELQSSAGNVLQIHIM